LRASVRLAPAGRSAASDEDVADVGALGGRAAGGRPLSLCRTELAPAAVTVVAGVVGFASWPRPPLLPPLLLPFLSVDRRSDIHGAPALDRDRRVGKRVPLQQTATVANSSDGGKQPQPLEIAAGAPKEPATAKENLGKPCSTIHTRPSVDAGDSSTATLV
jgi:hypothetical protein